VTLVSQVSKQSVVFATGRGGGAVGALPALCWRPGAAAEGGWAAADAGQLLRRYSHSCLA
jgi:hypothetical protein